MISNNFDFKILSHMKMECSSVWYDSLHIFLTYCQPSKIFSFIWCTDSPLHHPSTASPTSIHKNNLISKKINKSASLSKIVKSLPIKSACWCFTSKSGMRGIWHIKGGMELWPERGHDVPAGYYRGDAVVNNYLVSNCLVLLIFFAFNSKMKLFFPLHHFVP